MQNIGRKKLSLSLIALFFVALIVSGCHRSGLPDPKAIEEVKALMEKRAQAIQNKDIEMFKEVFLPDYNDGKGTYDDIVQGMAENFRNHKDIKFTYQRSPVDITMNSARMVGTLSYQGDKMEKPVFDHERTQFRRIDGRWYISAGVNIVVF